ncbi:MAG: hypothetical protein PHX18_04295 [Candidatus Gastranaerophilales bacterium]|nr:hypothetical protein [Candidatus Gastranaerophilales bacterium]
MTETIRLDITKLPLKLVISKDGKEKVYYIKTNKFKSGVFLNKAE